MEKAIYGLAKPFNALRPSHKDFLTNTYTFTTVEKEDVSFNDKVALTINHDYQYTFAVLGVNMSVRVTNEGIFFKAMPGTNEGFEAYEMVRRGILRHCSFSARVYEEEHKEMRDQYDYCSKLFGWKEKIVFNKYTKFIVHEFCLTNIPANDATFCTTNLNHPKLKGVFD